MSPLDRMIAALAAQEKGHAGPLVRPSEILRVLEALQIDLIDSVSLCGRKEKNGVMCGRYKKHSKSCPDCPMLEHAAVRAALGEITNTDSPPRLACMDCGLPYYLFPLDSTLPDEQWLMIHDSLGGVLCACCMVRRAKKLPHAVAVRMRIDFGEDLQ